jgi:hypothetical protein
VRFFVDENMLPVGRALAAVRDDVCHPGHAAIPEVPLGSKDPDWLPIIGKRELVLITRDNKIRSKPAELQAYKDHRIRAFFLTGKRDLTMWEKLDLVVRQWEKIEAAVTKNPKGPWAMAVTAGSSPRDVPLMPAPK